MRYKRKLTAFVILLTMVLGCTACGEKENISGQISGLESQDASATSQDGANETAETSDPTVEAEGSGTTDEEADKQLSLGRIQGGVYTNEYVGMACELDSSWQFYAAEELQDLSGIQEALEGTQVGDAMQGFEQIMDMQAENVEELTSMNVLYQKLTLQQRLAYAALDEEAIIDETLAQKDILVESYAQAGIMVEEMSKKTVTFMGEERVALWTKSTLNEIDYYTLQIFNYNLGEYSATITLASFVEDKTEGMLQLFYAL